MEPPPPPIVPTSANGTAKTNGAATRALKSNDVPPPEKELNVESPAAPTPAALTSVPPPPEDVVEATIKIPELRFSRVLLRQVSCWMLSLGFHTLLLVVTILLIAGPLKKHLLQAETFEVVQDRFEDLTVVLDEQSAPATEFTTATSPGRGSQTAGFVGGGGDGGGGGGGAIGGVGRPGFDTSVSGSGDGPRASAGRGMGNVGFASVGRKSLSADVPEGSPGDPQAIVDNYDQAFDRITQEIRLMLLKNKVLVVWLFDQSESMQDDQKEIRARIDRVYSELGLVQQAQGDALLTSVASYGAKWQLHTKTPTYDLDQIRAAINDVPVDETGLEMTCDAVCATVTALQSAAIQGRRQLAMILVSDESGDQKTNVEKLEAAIAAAKAARTRIYILGREAVFGYPYAHMRWSHPQAGTHWLPIDRGPETHFVEQLQTEGFQRRQDAHCSGFGPYEHCRMARETGGIFFMLPSLETNLVRGEKRRYELEAMRPYMPDLNARQEYTYERDKSELRATLWKVISDLNPYRPEIARHIDLRHHFSADIPAFINQVNAEQVKAQVYITYLTEAEKALERLKSRRDNEQSPRWRANYDLILAQILTYKVHVYEYGAYLEEFKKNPKKVPLTKPGGVRLAQWDVRHRQQTVAGELTRSYIERGREMFNGIIKEHAGTPWAARAEWELKRGFGVELVEHYVGPPGPRTSQPSSMPVKIPKL